jgi:general stress protein YciG
MAAERRRDISRKGGVAAHRKGTAHEWTPATAQEAGRMGSLARRRKRRSEEEPENRVGTEAAERAPAAITSDVESAPKPPVG